MQDMSLNENVNSFDMEPAVQYYTKLTFNANINIVSLHYVSADSNKRE